MNSTEAIEAVRLALVIIEQRRNRQLSKEQAAALLRALGLSSVSAEAES